jgi:two-component system LytT family sensor kinase
MTRKYRISSSPWLIWTLSIAFWSAYRICSFFLTLHQLRSEPGAFFRFLVSLLAGFFVSCLMGYWYRWHIATMSSLAKLAFSAVLTSFAGAVIWLIPVIALTASRMGLSQVMSQWHRYLLVNLISAGMLLLCWSGLYLGIALRLEWKSQTIRTEKAVALAQQAQLQMLRHQINPHFLFNALNAIRALIEENEAKARDVITDLSEFLRYSLISKSYADVPLRDELTAVRHYFSIQKKRYEDKLEVKIEVGPGAEDYPVLSFLVHPLVENAVKYGMKTSLLPLRISVEAFVADGDLHVRVGNTGRWVDPAKAEQPDLRGTGTGLANIRARLANAYPGRHSLEVVEKDGWVFIELRIGGLSSHGTKEPLESLDHR